MSLLETNPPKQTSTSPSLPRPEVKARPPICKKPPPSNEALPTPSQPGGKVKNMVSMFSHAETTPSANGDATPTAYTTTDSPRRTRGPKRAPTVKPKPRRFSLQPSISVDQAPPLPAKTSRILRQSSEQTKMEGGEEGYSTPVSRSAHDGKEVELHTIEGGAEEENGSCCDQDCSCVCHKHRPGMKIVWVPIDEDDDDDDEDYYEEDEDNYEMMLVEETKGRVTVRKEGTKQEERLSENNSERSGLQSHKEAGKDFKKVLNKMIGNRRKSDPGTQAIMKTLGLNRSQSPPLLPKRNPSPLSHLKASLEEEEDSIYDVTLVVLEPTPTKTSTTMCQELDIPLIRVRKPARRSKELSDNSDDRTSIQSVSDRSLGQPQEKEPPALPPRVPLIQNCPNPSPLAKTASDDRRLSCTSVNSTNQDVKEQKDGGSTDGENEDAAKDRFSASASPLKRVASIDWEARLQEEPLYQTYRATVITKEIRRQTVCRNISKTSADYHMDWTNRHGGMGSMGNVAASSTVPPSSSLWRDLPGVRDSGILETLSSEQCRYQESMFEVLTSEASYLRSLKVLTEHFLDSRELEEVLIIRDRKTLFSNVLRVREVSERFLKDLEDRMDESLVFSDICDIIHYHAQHNFPAYIDYVRNQVYQEKTFTTLMKTSAEFATVITRLQESPLCQRLPFVSFLLLPFQRITRIKMLIENILKRTMEGTKEEQTASKALESVSKIIDECNTEVGKMKQVEELIHLSKTLEFDKLKAIPIISQTRFLEKRGEVQEMARGNTLFALRPKFSPVCLFLFNDLLIIASKKGSERFVVHDHAHRSLVQVQPLGEDEAPNPNYEHCFSLTLLENHQGRTLERLMKAPSQSDLHRWMAAFPNPGNSDGDDKEVIYDDWDCPQVQCVEPYVAQQADELTLEPTEIINVLRKTTEGMCEGIRLSDGQKGWFPEANVLEITNEHVRRRNLRERYRVMQAARNVTNKTNT
ncbi:hypothetical protein UPYG_G00239670 [Umbra pygmaea]|uniref:Rho guanine nucleotide exchange factor 15 n=1 Tax=Umbra pygmaea TaxID=75934 RepID=A0ABD0WZ84_UMBPY